MFYIFSIVDMSDEHFDQSIRTTLFWRKKLCWFWRDVLRHCHPRPGTCTGALVQTQETRPQHLIHVWLTDHVTLYNNLICRPRFEHLPGDLANPCEPDMKTHVRSVNWNLRKKAWRPANSDIDFLSRYRCSKTQIKHQSKVKWTHYNTVEFKSL